MSYKLPPVPPRPIPVPPVPAPPVIRKAKDATGVPIPREIIDAWERSSEVEDLLHFVAVLKTRTTQAQESSDPFYARLDFNRVRSLLEGLRSELELIKPYAVCPNCNGVDAPSSCFCKGQGYLSRFHWKVCATTETKRITGRSGV